MHRILNIARNEKNKDDLIEQPVADFIFITSVKADLNLLSSLLLEKEFSSLKNNIRALEISNLKSSAQVDNYLLKTCLLYTSPSPRDRQKSRMPSSA